LGDISSWATPKPWWSLLYSTIVLYDYMAIYTFIQLLVYMASSVQLGFVAQIYVAILSS